MLETESRHFESLKEELLKHHEGKFALIVGEQLLGVFDHQEAAYTEGIEKCGNVPMLIKRIRAEEETENIPAMVLGLISAHL